VWPVRPRPFLGRFLSRGLPLRATILQPRLKAYLFSSLRFRSLSVPPRRPSFFQGRPCQPPVPFIPLCFLLSNDTPAFPRPESVFFFLLSLGFSPHSHRPPPCMSVPRRTFSFTFFPALFPWTFLGPPLTFSHAPPFSILKALQHHGESSFFFAISFPKLPQFPPLSPSIAVGPLCPPSCLLGQISSWRCLLAHFSTMGLRAFRGLPSFSPPWCPTFRCQ